MFDLEDKNRSYHGRLLDRGQTCLPVRKRDRLATLAKRVPWIGLATFLGRIVGEVAIFGGGLAIGAWIVLRFRLHEGGDGEWAKKLIVAGLACIVLSTVTRLLAWRFQATDTGRTGLNQLA
jgi:hypothetical protein